jgi:TonB-linked SusC/RagA family outer membrane protein
MKHHFLLMLTMNLIFFLLCMPVQGENLSSQSPTRRITGVVSSSDGESLPGVTVQVKGATRGTVTDFNGAFVLNVQESEVLVFTYLGFVSQEIPVSGRNDIRIVLQEKATGLDEVVVVAYGKQKKISVTGAIATIDTKDLKQSPSANLATSLAGRLPGLTAMQTSGQPGNDKVNLYLRGMGTFNNASPLILIDGIPRDNISTLDPNEVATVTILKDASATAVFGVRGANGVILITTRRGKEGKPELSISADYSLQSFLVEADRIHSWEFAELRNQAERNSNVLESDMSFTQYMIDKYRSGEDPVFYPDRNVIRDLFRKWAPQTRLNANFSGGSKDFSYFLNVGYVGQGGNFKTDPEEKLGYDPSFRMDRYSFRGNIDYNIAKNLTASLNIASYLEKMNSPQTVTMHGGDINYFVSDMYRWAWQLPPTQPGPLTAEGYGVPAGQVVNEASNTQRNVYSDINRRGYAQNTTTTLNSSLSLDWGLDFITKGLSAKGTMAFDSHALTNLQGYKAFDVYDVSVAKSAEETSYYIPMRTNVPAEIQLDKIMGTHYYMNSQVSLEYGRAFGSHNVTGLALVQRDNWDGDPYGADIPYNILGFVGRATYNFDNRYLAEFNIGYNGSEQFAPKNRFGTFPAISAGWVVSNEKFLRDNGVISNLKLRGSYGLTGNDTQGARFLYFTHITTEGGIYSSLGKGLSINQGLLANEIIQWEAAEKKNLGFDLEVFKSLSLTTDFYKEHRDKILIGRNTIPVLQGVPIGNIPRVNLGAVDNKGFETELAYKKIINRDFSMNVKANFSYNENIVKFADEIPLDGYYVPYRSTGFSIGQNFGYEIDYSNGNGYINTQEELDALPVYDVGGTPRLGDFKYIDQNGDGTVDVKDQVPIGYSNVPRISYGFSGTLNYKSFDLSFLLTGIAKSSYYLDGFGVTEFAYAGFYSGWHLKAWTQERYENGEEILYPALGTDKGVSQKQNSVFIMDRSFLRLKNLEIGYKLPDRLVKKLSLTSTRVYVNGNNLLTWKKYPINTVDPEQEGNLAYGLTRMINFGVNVVF